VLALAPFLSRVAFPRLAAGSIRGRSSTRPGAGYWLRVGGLDDPPRTNERGQSKKWLERGCCGRWNPCVRLEGRAVRAAFEDSGPALILRWAGSRSAQQAA